MADLSFSINNYARDISAKFDEISFDCLAKCGYSKEYILVHNWEFFITRGPLNLPIGSDIGSTTDYTFFHGDEKLFTIHEIIGSTYSLEHCLSTITVSFSVTWAHGIPNSQDLQGL